MITTMKKFENPMLQVVSIVNNDIITESLGVHGTTTNTQLAPGQRGIDEWYEGF